MQFCLFLIYLALSGAAVGLDVTERRLIEVIDASNDEALALLEQTVNMNSGTMNTAGVRAVGDVMRAEFEALGFATEWIDGEPYERAGHLVARRGSEGLHLLLIGHLDTVFELDSPFQKFERIDDTHARGPGTTDMKGGNVVMLYALRALREAGVLDSITVTAFLMGDEERVGKPVEIARKELKAAADIADVALGFEDGDGNPTTAVVSRRGSSGWELHVKGRPAHSSVIFREDTGSGAIFETARILHEFRTQLAGEELLTFNPGMIVGGTTVDFDPWQARGRAFGKNNVIAEHALVTGDLRTISPQQLDRARERMQAIVADNLPHTSATLSFRDGYPPLDRTEGNLALLAMFDEVSRDLGYGPVTAVDPEKAGAADISFTSGLVDMAMDGLGLMGTGGHTVDETADLTTLPMQTQRVAVLIYRLARR